MRWAYSTTLLGHTGFIAADLLTSIEFSRYCWSHVHLW